MYSRWAASTHAGDNRLRLHFNKPAPAGQPTAMISRIELGPRASITGEQEDSAERSPFTVTPVDGGGVGLDLASGTGLVYYLVAPRRGAPGLPQSVQALPQLLRDAPWVAFERDGMQRVYDRWMQQQLAQAQVRVRVDIFNAVAAMLHTGIGVGILPTFMQSAHPDLLPVSEVIPELSVPVWMLTHPDLRQTARVRAFMQHVGDALAQRLQGP